jgi:hypothetical protein
VGDDKERIQETLAKSDSISTVCWEKVSSFSHNPNSLVMTTQVVPALNAVIDIVTTREASRKNVVPRLIIVVLGLLTVISSFLAGYGSKGMRGIPIGHCLCPDDNPGYVPGLGIGPFPSGLYQS